MESNTEIKNFIVDDESVESLRETRKWTFFLSIVGMIFLGLGFLFVVFMSVFLPDFSGQGLFPRIPFVFMMIIFMMIYFFPIYFLLQFSKYSKRAIDFRNDNDIRMTFKYLKYHFKYIGILMIIFIGIYLFVGLIAFLVGSIL